MASVVPVVMACGDTNGCEETAQADLDDDCNPRMLTEDLDGDGFTSDEDCDDLDPEVNPAQSEIPYDGIDNDCSPDTRDLDADGDGALLADDCDDFDPTLQDQVGSFASITAGSDLCTRFCEIIIFGDVAISGNSIDSDVAWLDCVSEIEGNLTIDSNPKLKEILLPTLRSIQGRLEVHGNATLTSLQVPNYNRCRNSVSRRIRFSSRPLSRWSKRWSLRDSRTIRF
ncbi:MAG: MopE-related protein [Myxococcota bacterium]